LNRAMFGITMIVAANMTRRIISSLQRQPIGRATWNASHEPATGEANFDS